MACLSISLAQEKKCFRFNYVCLDFLSQWENFWFNRKTSCITLLHSHWKMGMVKMFVREEDISWNSCLILLIVNGNSGLHLEQLSESFCNNTELTWFNQVSFWKTEQFHRGDFIPAVSYLYNLGIKETTAFISVSYRTDENSMSIPFITAVSHNYDTFQSLLLTVFGRNSLLTLFYICVI